VPAARSILAEDEPVLREELAEMLGTLWPELEIVAKVPDGVAALRALEQHHPDVMFLDIQMPGLSGLDVARQVAGRCHIVFVTAYDQYAVAAFEQGAVDYVLKPFYAGRLVTTISRLKDKLTAPPVDLSRMLSLLSAAGSAGRQYLRWINASRGSAVRLITVEEIVYFKADSKYTCVFTRDGESLIRKTIKELTDELDPEAFLQIHRSTVVNVNAIDSVLRDIGGHVKVRLKTRSELLPVSETYAHLFRSM
jgi:DNA-binding LytR/AlgR family response regulator